MKLHENPWSGSRAVHAEGRAGDITKLMVAFHSFWLHPSYIQDFGSYRTVNTLLQRYKKRLI
jgi:hypothetical protein